MNSLRKTLLLGARLVKIAARNPSRLSHVLGVTLSATGDVMEKDLDLLRLPIVQITDLLPPDGLPERIELILFSKTNASISVLEFIGLVLLLKKAKGKNVFEFGTYKGVSITQMALN